MRSIVSTTKTVFIVVSYVLVLFGVVCQSTPYRLRERPDCEPHCHKIQQLNESCPTYGSCLWYCQENQANCKQSTRYHCARDLHNKERFIEACSVEIFCLAGEEPHISKEDSEKVSVYCRPCYQRNRYNSQYNTSSATFSECHSAKTNLCTEQENKVDCGNVSFMELTKTDGYCRCDARKGYAAQSEEMCFYENKRCFKKNCLEGEELSLNYSCAKECPAGLARPKTSDNCQHVITLPPATTPVFTTVGKDYAQHLSTGYYQHNAVWLPANFISVNTKKKPDRSPGLNKIIPALIFTAVLVFSGIVFLVVCKHKIGKWQLRQQEKHSTKEEIPLKLTKAGEEVTKELNQDIRSEEKMSLVEDNIGKVSHSESEVDTGKPVTTTARAQAPQAVGPVERKDTSPTLKTAVKTQVTQAVVLLECEDATRSTVTTVAETHDTQGMKSPKLTPGSNINDGQGATSDKPDRTDVSSQQKLQRMKSPKVTSGCNINDGQGATSDKPADVASQKKLQPVGLKELKGATAGKTTSETHVTKAADPVESNGATGPPVINTDETYVTQAVGLEEREAATRSNVTTTVEPHDTKGQQERKVSTGLTVTTTAKTQDSKGASVFSGLAKWNPFRRVNDGKGATSDKHDNVSSQKKTQVGTKTTATERAFSKSKSTGNTWQDWCVNVYQSLVQQTDFIYESGFEYDNLKGRDIMELTSCQTIHAIDADGFEAYAIPEENTTDLFVLISHLLCGNGDLKDALRIAAARVAIYNFKEYTEKLVHEFGQSKTPLNDAHIFFSIHGIYYKEFKSRLKKRSVSLALDNLVQGILVSGRTGPFHAELLSGVLNCNIVQHFENNRYCDHDVRTISGLKVALKSSSSRCKELHICWMTSTGNDKYCILPLFNMSDQTSTEKVNVPQVTKCVMDKVVLEKIIEQKPYKWRNCFTEFARRHDYVCDSLKDREIIKPDTIIRTIDISGYKAYEKPGTQTTAVYEWISELISGDKSLMYILRLAAARYALKNCATYITKLTDVFNNSLNPLDAAKVFFTAHEIEFEDNKDSNIDHCVSLAFKKLVRETVNAGKGNAPFYVEFLSGVLNRKITQHFEKNCYNGRDRTTIPGIDVSLTTEASSKRDLHMYWMKSSGDGSQPYRIVPLIKCVPNGMDLCEDVYTLLVNQQVFEAQSCLDRIHTEELYAFDQLKKLGIIKPDQQLKLTRKTINVPGYTAYEKPGEEPMCLYECMSYLLFGNADMRYFMRLAALRYALQNFDKYVNKLTDETKLDDAELFFKIHRIKFKKRKKAPGVLTAFADLMRETVNTGQGPFYVEFLRGALNCKITQHFEEDRYYDREVRLIPGLNVTLTTTSLPARELHIYWMKTSRARSSSYKIVPLFKCEDR